MKLTTTIYLLNVKLKFSFYLKNIGGAFLRANLERRTILRYFTPSSDFNDILKQLLHLGQNKKEKELTLSCNFKS